MPLVQFYHLTATPLERALPKLLEKAYTAGHRMALVTGNDEKAEYYNQLLWTHDPASFLPHGTAADGLAEQQPIFISSVLVNTNRPTIAVITDGSMVTDISAFERVLDLFDGHDGSAVEAARTRWAQYRETGMTLSYMQQSAQGGWQDRKAA